MENNRDSKNTFLFYERVLAHVNRDNTPVNDVKEGTVGSFKEVLNRVIGEGDGADKLNRSDFQSLGQTMVEDLGIDDIKDKD